MGGVERSGSGEGQWSGFRVSAGPNPGAPAPSKCSGQGKLGSHRLMSKLAKMAHEAAVVVDVRGQPRHDVPRRVATHAKRALDMVPWRVTLLECERSLGGQKAVDSAGVVSSSGARPVARCFPLGPALSVSPSADRRVLSRRSGQTRAPAKVAVQPDSGTCACCEAMSRISSPLRAPRCTTAGRPPVAKVHAAPLWLSRQAEYARTAPGYTGLQPRCKGLPPPPGCIGRQPSRRGGRSARGRTAAARAAGRLARQVVAAEVS